MSTQSGKFGVRRFMKEQKAVLPYPDRPLNGLTVLVTGANTGVGLEAARHVVRLNAANLILAVRSTTKGEAAREDLMKSCPQSTTNISIYSVDYCSFASVKSFAEKIINEVPKLDIAILNAGLNAPEWRVTGDGWEEVLQVNVLSTTYLALLLLPKIRESYNKSADHMPALVVVTSDTHYVSSFKQKKAADQKLGILNAMNDKAISDGFDKYPTSKLLEVYIVRQLANWVDRNMQGEVIVTCVNPGLCHSDLNRNSGLVYYGLEFFKWVIARTSEVGSRNYMWAALAGRQAHGQYVGSCEVQKPAVLVTSEEGERLAIKVYQEVGQVLTALDGGVEQYFA
ncbi:hypothetical protein Dda_6303 [Drechslerella dactyloides]|uniref:Uncharacterized protein n=1 Tax=Drechslerella dactyloides TaxID=74499 RepID=A0AAD6NIH6_DREDA|nr:hypothetical protein Dda_6303 [Drechslerella dactyloides]